MESSVKRWRCDTCHQWLTADQGYVAWDTNDKYAAYGFRIIHRQKCDDRSYMRSVALADYMGPDGFARATSIMSLGPIALTQIPPDERRARIADMDEYCDFLRRLFLPNYEEAREFFSSKKVQEKYYDSSESRPYFQDYLKLISSGS